MRLLEGIPAGLQRNWEHRREDCECRRQVWEHLRAPVTNLEVLATNLGVPVTSLGAPRITEQSGKNNLLFGNAASACGNHSYYLLFNDF